MQCFEEKYRDVKVTSQGQLKNVCESLFYHRGIYCRYYNQRPTTTTGFLNKLQYDKYEGETRNVVQCQPISDSAKQLSEMNTQIESILYL